MRTGILLICFLFSIRILSQENLIPNSSFETIIECPENNISQSQILKANPWWNACRSNTINTTDLFNSCNTGILSVPFNQFGFQNANTGNCYAGFIAWIGGLPNNWGEYLEVKLNKTIKANDQYRLCFQLNIANYGNAFGLNKIRFSLTQDSLNSVESNMTIANQPFFPTLNSLDLYETSNCSAVGFEDWFELCTDFTLNRDANYLTIGTFIRNGENHDTLLINPEEPWNRSTYYFIDDISLICITPTGCDDVGVEEVEQQITIHLFPNPTNSYITLQSPLIKPGSTLFLRDISGRLIHQEKIQQLNNLEIPTQELVYGIYFVQLIGSDGIQAQVKFVVQHDGSK